MTDVDVLLSLTLLRREERMLKNALTERGLRVETALLRDTVPFLNQTREPPRAVLVRNLSHRDASGIAQRFERAGIETVNAPGVIDLCNDKSLQGLLFREHGLPHPTSYVAYSVEQVGELVEYLSWEAVVKPVAGSWGRGVVRIASEESLEAWLGARESLDATGRHFPVLVQAYVPKPGHDLRVVVVDREPIAAIKRVSNHWRTNTHLGAVMEATEVSEPMRKLSKRLVDVLGPGFYGVDLMEDALTHELMVLEVNANPDFAASSEVHGVDVAGHVASYVERVCTRPAVRGSDVRVLVDADHG